MLLAPAGVWVPKGTPVFVLRAEVCNDDAEDALTWTEKLPCEKVGAQLAKRGLAPNNFLCIADATGKNQGASGLQRGHNSDPELELAHHQELRLGPARPHRKAGVGEQRPRVELHRCEG